MYPIVTEKGLNDAGKMEYEVFGIRLKEYYEIQSVLKNMKRLKMLEKGSDYPLLRKVLNENARDRVMIKKAHISAEEVSWEDVSNETIKKYYDLVSLLGYERLVNEFWRGDFDFPTNTIYHEMLRLFNDYFGDSKKSQQKTEIKISRKLNFYLETFQQIKFTLHRDTAKRTVVGPLGLRPLWYNTRKNLPTALANTMALMLLTGQTTYFDNGEEKPIIIGGTPREKLIWGDRILSRYSSYRGKYGDKNEYIETNSKSYKLTPNSINPKY